MQRTNKEEFSVIRDTLRLFFCSRISLKLKNKEIYSPRPIKKKVLFFKFLKPQMNKIQYSSYIKVILEG